MKKLTYLFDLNLNVDYRVRTAYIINGISMVLALIFIYIYGFYARYYVALPGIVLYFLSTLAVFVLFKMGHATWAKILMLIGFILQESSIVFLLFSNNIHFNLFYFIVAPITFFVFDFEKPLEKIMSVAFSSLTIVLFTLSEILVNRPAVVTPTPEIVLLFNAISAFSAILLISIVFIFFSQELMKSHRELKHLANTDGLTSIYNRRTFFDRGEYEFNLARKYERRLAVILLDVDHFKNVNDGYGHLCGDKVLVQTANLIRSMLRKSDLISRYGGEEFAVLLKETDYQDSWTVAEKIRQSIEGYAFDIGEGKHLNITVSIGVAEIESANERFEQLVKRADQHLYEAKEMGRNRVC